MDLKSRRVTRPGPAGQRNSPAFLVIIFVVIVFLVAAFLVVKPNRDPAIQKVPSPAPASHPPATR